MDARDGLVDLYRFDPFNLLHLMRSEARHIPSQEQSAIAEQTRPSPERSLYVVRSTETKKPQNKQTDGDDVRKIRTNIDVYLDTQSAAAEEENASDASLEFPTLKQAQGDVLKAKESLRALRSNLAWAKDGLKEVEEELREAQRLPEKYSDELRAELALLKRTASEGDPDIDDLQDEIKEAEEEEQKEGYVSFLEESEQAYQEMLDEIAEFALAVENAQTELLTCQRILEHVQKQSPAVAGLWGRMRRLFLSATPKKEQEISVEPEDDDHSLQEAA